MHIYTQVFSIYHRRRLQWHIKTTFGPTYGTGNQSTHDKLR